MSNEDFQQIRAILHEEIAATEQRITARQDRAIETIAGETSSLRAELSVRMDTVERRLNGFATTLYAVDQRTAGHTRAIDELLNVHGRDAGTLAGITRTVEQLAARVAALEAKQNGQK